MPDEPTTFLSLPAELRNYIYDLSGCLKIYQCRRCCAITSGDKLRPGDAICGIQTRGGRSSCSRGLGMSHCEYRPKAFLWVNPENPGKDTRRSDRLNICRLSERHLQRHLVSTSPPALTQVSRQVRADTLPMFYGGNVFYITVLRRSDGLDQIPKWLNMVGKEQAALVKDFRVFLPKGVETARVERVRKTLVEMEEAGEVVKWNLVEGRAGIGDCYCDKHVLPWKEEDEAAKAE